MHGKIKVVLDDGAYMPVRGHEWDAGLDLKLPDTYMGGLYVRGHDEVRIDTGVHIQIPHGYAGVLASKSGLNFNKYLDTPGGIIDSEFTGSIKVVIENRGEVPRHFLPGDKVVQLLILKCATPVPVQVDSLGDTERGNSGWGSTGR